MKSGILFVDDEVRILQGLQRMLRGCRGDWDMEFVQSGEEALHLLSTRPFQVIVSDMRMPGMNGAELLDHVKRRHPNVVRLILSGQASEEAALRSVGPAHQFLPKPCDADTLRSTLRRACALRGLLGDDQLRELLSRVGSLPSPPGLYLQIVSELESPAPSVRRVGEIVATDPGMTAKILQLVNSAFFGFRQHVADPQHAVSLLGLNTVTALVLSLKIFSEYDPARMKALGLAGLMPHSMRVGLIARAIAEHEGMGREPADHSFTAGLLHDVGRLILANWVGAGYTSVAARLPRHDAALCEVEQEFCHATHAQVGAYVLGLWGLPDGIVEAVAYHHQPGACPRPADARAPLLAVHAADVLAYEQAQNWPGAVTGFDMEYLGSVGAGDRVQAWRARCAARPSDSGLAGNAPGCEAGRPPSG